MTFWTSPSLMAISLWLCIVHWRITNTLHTRDRKFRLAVLHKDDARTCSLHLFNFVVAHCWLHIFRAVSIRTIYPEGYISGWCAVFISWNVSNTPEWLITEICMIIDVLMTRCSHSKGCLPWYWWSTYCTNSLSGVISNLQGRRMQTSLTTEVGVIESVWLLRAKHRLLSWVSVINVF